MKKEKEMQFYDPFGRGGAGAPVRGKDGQLMTDLRQMSHINKQLEENVDLVRYMLILIYPCGESYQLVVTLVLDRNG